MHLRPKRTLSDGMHAVVHPGIAFPFGDCGVHLLGGTAKAHLPVQSLAVQAFSSGGCL